MGSFLRVALYFRDLSPRLARHVRLGPIKSGQTINHSIYHTRFYRRPAMNTFTRMTVLTLLASLSLVSLAALPAAAQSKLLLVAPESDPSFAPEYCLPEFGFASFNIRGVGERVTFVRWGGLASRLGLEPGDIILSMNDVRLTYHGSWNHALRHVISEHGGWVQLRVRDVRTGMVAYRQTFVGGGIAGGGVGPITEHYYVGENVGPHQSHMNHHVGYPSGPVTAKSTAAGGRRSDTNRTVREIARLFD
jgi:hypothetical protein